MKKLMVVGAIMLFGLLIGSSQVAAEESSSSTEGIEAVLESESSSWEVQETDDTAITDKKEETAVTETDGPRELRNLRETLLYFEHVPKELLDQLTDEQIEEVNKLARETFGAQGIELTERLLVRIYGPNPIPKESYLTEYGKMSPEEFKTYLPQIRLSLIHVFDVNEQKLASISDTQLISWIDEVTKEAISPIYWIVGLEDKVVGRANSVSESSSTTESNKSSESSKEETSKEQEKTNKKGGLPSTGEMVRTSLVIVGVILVLIVGFILLKRRKK